MNHRPVPPREGMKRTDSRLVRVPTWVGRPIAARMALIVTSSFRDQPMSGGAPHLGAPHLLACSFTLICPGFTNSQPQKRMTERGLWVPLRVLLVAFHLYSPTNSSVFH